MILFALTMRVLLFLVCTETAVRYAFWWRKIRREPEPGILLPLMLGIGVAQAGIAIRHVDMFYYANPTPMLWIVLLADAFMLIGTLLHLTPAWRISHGYSDRRIKWGIAIRVVVAAVLAGAIVYADFFLMLRPTP